MKYVVLEKAHVKGFLRTRLGHIERVNPYDRRPIPRKIVAALQKQFNLESIRIETKDVTKRQAFKILLDHLGKLADKVTIDGKGELKIVVGDVLSDFGVPGARYDYNNVEIEISNKHQETLAHEYAHYIMDHNLWSRKNYYKEKTVWSEDYAPWIKLRLKASQMTIDEFKEEFKTNYTNYVNTEKFVTPEQIAVKELLVNLGKYYESKIDIIYDQIMPRLGEKQPWGDYLTYHFNPAEIFARAVNAYVEPLEAEKWEHYSVYENGEYYKIVNAWGRKYLKTGLVKGQSYFRNKNGKWEHVNGYIRHGITKKCIACKNEYGFIKEPKEKNAITAGICPTCFKRISFQRKVTTA